MKKTKNHRRRAGGASGVFACLTACLWAAPLSAQTLPEERSQSSGIHFLAGGFVGRFDLDGAGRTDLFGGRAGVGYGELLQLTGFYWRGFDRSADSVTADRAWGGELQFNLNSGFGVTPFLTGGIARVRTGELEDQTAALAGAGLTLPLWRVLLHVAVRDYMFGITGLENDDSPDDVTHNWLYSAGVKFALGQRRRDTGPVAVAPRDDRALQEARAELTELRDSVRLAGRDSVWRIGRDSVRLAGGEPDARDTRARSLADDGATPRNYQSAERIEIPLPTEGSITLRYGPERTANAGPLVVSVPGASTPLATVAGETRAAPGAPPPPPGATLDDPATQAWLQQQVASQVAQQLARTPAATSALTTAQLDALAQRVLDGVLATVVPRLEAAQARRIDDLRADLRVALQQQRVAGRADVAVEQTPFVPPTAQPAPATTVEPAVPAPAQRVPAEDVAAEAARAEAALRASLGAIVTAHPAYLTSRETERGRAAVVGEAAFESGAALVSSGARPAIRALAATLQAHPDRRVYIQGHTDAVGDELSNQRLSELRAEAVRSLLVQEGVAADRLYAIGYGQARPVADNATPHRGARRLPRAVAADAP